jgi:uncharacterized protein (DUF433 family)
MATKIPYIERKQAIVESLLRCARQRQTIFYGELGQEVGIPARGPWKPVLDEIAREETEYGRPDITFLVINRETGLPGQIGFKPAKPPTVEQRRAADDEIRKIFAYYSPAPTTMAEHSRITLAPEVLAGKPVIRGTRLSVEFVIGLMADGWTEADILRNYPGVTHEDIIARLAYARDTLSSEKVYPSAA